MGTSRLLFEEVSGEKLLLSEEAEQLKILLKREIQKLDGELRAKVRSGDPLSYNINTGIEADVDGNGIEGSCISVWYRNIPVPDWVPLFRYWSGSGIGMWTDRMPDIKKTLLRWDLLVGREPLWMFKLLVVEIHPSLFLF